METETLIKRNRVKLVFPKIFWHLLWIAMVSGVDLTASSGCTQSPRREYA